MAEEPDPVVAGVDGSACSLGALRWAADEAARRGRPLRIVHAVGSSSRPAHAAAQELIDDAERAAHEWQPAVSVAGLVRAGRPAAELCAESEQADLVVLGNRGRGGLTGLVLGSVSTQVAVHAHGPVLVVRDGQQWAGPEASLRSHRPVVVGVDGSPPSDLAAGLAFEEAARLGAELVAVRAWQPPDQPWRSDAKPPILDVDEIEAAELHRLADSVAPWRVKYPRVAVRLRLMPDSAGAALVAASQDARLMVVGTRGHGGFSGLLLGSAGQQALHHASCPVLVARERGPVGPDRELEVTPCSSCS